MADRKVAVVAGGGSGIGRGCALKLAELGYELVLIGRNADRLNSVADRISSSGGSASGFAVDVRDWDRLEQLAAQFADRGIDLLVNSVGGQFAKPAADLSENGWRSVVETNLFGSFYLCRHLYQALRRRRGAIVTVVADIWRKPAPRLVHSAAARAGVVNMTRTLALEWAGDGIRVNAVSPGLTDTPALHESYHHLVDTVPLGRIGSVADMVDAIVFLAKAPYITGEVLAVDGGLNLT